MLVYSVVLLAVLFFGETTGREADVQHIFAPIFSNDHDVLTPDMRNFIQDVVHSHNVPGLSLAFVRAEGEVEFGNWGVRSDEGNPMTSDTLFTMASCSKAFLASAMGILMDDFAQGQNSTPLPHGVLRFDWNTKVKDILPGQWELMDTWANEMATIQDILSHVSGLPAHDLVYSRGDSSQDILFRLKHLRPSFELRERWSYSNIMYMVGQYIISKYTGSFVDFVEARIFRPLNMSATYLPTDALASGRATENWTNKGRRIPWWFTENDYELLSGPGGVIASAEDMAKWLRMILHSGVNPSNNSTVIPVSILSDIATARVITNGAGSDVASISGYGMGWERLSLFGHEVVTHGGGLNGISTAVLFAPQDDVGIVILTNADWKHEAIKTILIALLRKAWDQAHDSQSLLPSLFRPFSSHSNVLSVAQIGIHTAPHYDFTGAYTDAGFGTFVICNSSSTSHYCSDVLAAFAAVDDAATESLPANATQLFAAWPRYWTTHLRFVHLDGMRFVLRPTALFPGGYGKDKTPFETYEGGFGEYAEAEFVVEDGEVKGLGMFVRAELGRGRNVGVQERASAWFTRV